VKGLRSTPSQGGQYEPRCPSRPAVRVRHRQFVRWKFAGRSPLRQAMFCYLRTVRSWPLHSDCRFWICPQGIAPAPVRRAACLRSTPPRISLHCNLDVFERQAYIRFFSDFMCAVQRQAKALTPTHKVGWDKQGKRDLGQTGWRC
jgi:hypothetical protein